MTRSGSRPGWTRAAMVLRLLVVCIALHPVAGLAATGHAGLHGMPVSAVPHHVLPNQAEVVTPGTGTPAAPHAHHGAHAESRAANASTEDAREAPTPPFAALDTCTTMLCCAVDPLLVQGTPAARHAERLARHLSNATSPALAVVHVLKRPPRLT